MPPISTDSGLTESIDYREAQRRLGYAESYLQGLEFAVAMATQARVATPHLEKLKAEVVHARTYVRQLISRRKGMIQSRKRPKKKSNGKKCFVFFDECGSHHAVVQEHDYQAFVLAAAIVKEEDLQSLNDGWNKWKESVWGTSDVIMHEPDVRKNLGPWYFKNATQRRDAKESLDSVLASLPYNGIAVVVRRPQYIEYCKDAGLDSSLPLPIYDMALDFLCERVAMALEEEYDGAIGEIIAEARGAKDDARLQQEFVRLHIDGTSYIADSWFRQQLGPAIDFRQKKENIPGLQIADLLARPCGDKVLRPESSPPRWEIFKKKLVKAQKTVNSPLGMKIMPWSDELSGLFPP